jgi:hypothetical protein
MISNSNPLTPTLSPLGRVEGAEANQAITNGITLLPWRGEGGGTRPSRACVCGDSHPSIQVNGFLQPKVGGGAADHDFDFIRLDLKMMFVRIPVS